MSKTQQPSLVAELLRTPSCLWRQEKIKAEGKHNINLVSFRVVALKQRSSVTTRLTILLSIAFKVSCFNVHTLLCYDGWKGFGFTNRLWHRVWEQAANRSLTWKTVLLLNYGPECQEMGFQFLPGARNNVLVKKAQIDSYIPPRFLFPFKLNVNLWIFTFIPTYIFMLWCLIKNRDTFFTFKV